MDKIGFLVNPTAGMGGRVGLKGTDGNKTLTEAIRRGARPVSPERGLRFLEELRQRDDRLHLMIAPGIMGERIAEHLPFKQELIGRIGKTTTSQDTSRIARLMKEKSPDLIVFCGGDGTAKDVLEGVGPDLPVLGVPAGVKVYSSVFAINPIAAADSASAFLHEQIPTRMGEIVDVDEEAFRTNRLSVRLFGHLTTPDSGPMMQASKSSSGLSEDNELDAIADSILELIDPAITYVLGPGSTVERVARRLGVSKTLLGVDAVRGDGKLIGADLEESSLLRLLSQGPVKVIVSPIGGQGFLFGRGNQQISPDVIRKVGLDNILVIASRSKIESLRPRRLVSDSGSEDIDARIRGYVRVITGYREEMVVKVE